MKKRYLVYLMALVMIAIATTGFTSVEKVSTATDAEHASITIANEIYNSPLTFGHVHTEACKDEYKFNDDGWSWEYICKSGLIWYSTIDYGTVCPFCGQPFAYKIAIPPVIIIEPDPR